MTVGAIGIDTSITSIKMQPDFWAGLFPSVVSYMYNVTGIQFIEGHETTIGLELETGTLARNFNRVPETGELLSSLPEIEYGYDEETGEVYPIYSDDEDIRARQELANEYDSYDTLYAGFNLTVSQGFGQSSHGDGDLFKLSAGVKGRWEISVNPILDYGERSGMPFYWYPYFNGDKKADYLIGTPDLSGNRQLFDIAFYVAGDLKNLFRSVASAEGANVYLEMMYSPKFTNTSYEIGGRSEFFKLLLNSSQSFMLKASKDEKGDNIWSLGLSNAIAFRYLTGSAVPAYAETLNLPLGWYTPENTKFIVEDIIKLEYYGRQFFKYFVPKLSVFVDLSYNWGELNNNSLGQSLNTFCGSAGIHVELMIGGNISIYYEMGRVFAYTGPDAEYFIGYRSSDSLKFSLSVEF